MKLTRSHLWFLGSLVILASAGVSVAQMANEHENRMARHYVDDVDYCRTLAGEPVVTFRRGMLSSGKRTLIFKECILPTESERH